MKMDWESFWIFAISVFMVLYVSFLYVAIDDEEKQCSKAGGVRVRAYSGTVCIDAKALK